MTYLAMQRRPYRRKPSRIGLGALNRMGQYGDGGGIVSTGDESAGLNTSQTPDQIVGQTDALQSLLNSGWTTADIADTMTRTGLDASAINTLSEQGWTQDQLTALAEGTATPAQQAAAKAAATRAAAASGGGSSGGASGGGKSSPPVTVNVLPASAAAATSALGLPTTIGGISTSYWLIGGVVLLLVLGMSGGKR